MKVEGGVGELFAPAGDSAPSLQGLHRSVPVPPVGAGFWRQWRAFVGPAVLVSVGYMDPGNWSSDLAAGATYRYQLLWVVALSSLMAIIVQICAARLGVVTGKDLAQACRDHFPAWTRWPNWLSCEIAIGACDLAEVLGSAVAITLLFPNITLFWAVLITACDVLLLLAMQGLGMRLIEALVLVLVLTIGICFAIELFVLPKTMPHIADMGQDLLRPDYDQDTLWLIIAIIGATVMPHNLYLHSALVQSRRSGTDEGSIRQAIRFNTLDSLLALSVAFLINAAILVLAAHLFHGLIDKDKDPDYIREAYGLLQPLLGVKSAMILFAVALLASGQSSTITGTMAGQVVMEGFLHWRLRPWIRRTITRFLAIIPVVVIIGVLGDQVNVNKLLNLSQVILGLQLPLALVPLLYFTGSRRIMGQYANGWFLLTAGWASCAIVIVLDALLILKTCGVFG
jgi:manganese transport protein